MIDVQAKMKMIEAILLKQSLPNCDNNCAQQQNKEVQKLISEVQGPVH